MQAASNNARRPYQALSLRTYGRIQGLTAGGTGAVMESGMGMNLAKQGPPPFP